MTRDPMRARCPLGTGTAVRSPTRVQFVTKGRTSDLNRAASQRGGTIDAGREYETAKLLLIVVVCVSLLIATATGSWIALGISRGASGGPAYACCEAVAGRR